MFFGSYIIVGITAFCQGIILNIIGISHLSEFAIAFLFKDTFGLEPDKLSYIYSIVSIPWLFKPIFGYISDTYPIFGYRRKSYLLIFSFS